MAVELGKRYRDTISGFEGVATCRAEFLFGCVRITLSSEVANGEPKDFVFDEPQLSPVGHGADAAETPPHDSERERRHGSRDPAPRTGH